MATRKPPRAAAPTPAFAALQRADVPHTTHTYTHDPRSDGYGVEAAAALDVSPERVLKTLMVQVDGADPVAALVPVTTQLDLKAVAAALGGKRAQMADPQMAQRATGYVLGGISPFGQRQPHRTVVDSSALSHATVFVSGGRRGLEIELSPQDLVSTTGAVAASVSS
ncbi:Cys-tRNA(Pro) deacylase [Aeromicrobium sp. CF3.5]|uniref:Cys-tRNA(Pro) deacylase n=1 Tax=Aeromicrobium sp. CF3.5 TaxID=3373078 RepID=UPI003EE6CD86